MRNLGKAALGTVFLLWLAGCSGPMGATDPWEELVQSEDRVFSNALALVNQAESALGTQSLATQGISDRPVTVVSDGEEFAVVAPSQAYSPPQTPQDLAGKPLGLVIKCPSRRPCVWMALDNLSGEEGNHRIRWSWKGSDGSPIEEYVPADVSFGPSGADPSAKPRWSYNKLGLGGFWADALVRYPFEVHILAPSPSGPYQEGLSFPAQNPTLPFQEALRRACCGLPTPFSKNWPPALLMREDIVLAFIPYDNPRLNTATSPQDLIGEPLGLLYLRKASQGKLTKADAARLVEIEMVQEAGDFVLVGTDLRNQQTLRFAVGQVEWCDGCFGSDPPPRYLGITDRIGASPIVHLQVGPLMLHGIEKKDLGSGPR